MAFSKDKVERELQRRFYADFLPRVDPEADLSDILVDYSDGVLNGNILEMKKNLKSANESLFQAIKYLSARRIAGKPITENILVVSLQSKTVRVYKSIDYLQQIETVYSGAASKNLGGFVAHEPSEKIKYSTQKGQSRLVELLKTKNYTKTNLDENCIVGWANTFYAINRSFSKQDFLGYDDDNGSAVGEIRSPDVLAEYINPYPGETNVKFNYLMDCLNDFLNKKNLGAFFTPEPYAKKAAELVRKAIDRVPEGNDYVIIDRCAGTGNLELALTEEERSHCIVSTYEYFEYKVLNELIGGEVLEIIPPVESDDTFMRGMVRGSDALSREFVENEVIAGYVNDPNCTVILFENPPFAETTSIEHQRRGAGRVSTQGWKSSWVVQQMKKAIKADGGISPRAVNDIGNTFIWSGFEYYLRQPTDSYVVFSPIKYWKAQGLINRKLLGGFAANRQHFHARKRTCVAVTLWSAEESAMSSFELESYDIKDGELDYCGALKFERIAESYSKRFYDKRPLSDPDPNAIRCGLDGTERPNGEFVPSYSKDILGYMAVYSSGFDEPDLHSSLLVAARYDGHGFYLRRDDFLDKLPMFAASRYISYNGSWTERGRIMKSADGWRKYQNDVKNGVLDDFLRKCLLFTCFEYQNHMRSFKGSDGRDYRNELCLDVTNGQTDASKKLKGWKKGSKENELMEAWRMVLRHAKQTANYDGSLTYGLYQIGEELNTHHVDEETGDRIFDYPELNGAIKALKELTKAYYLSEIVPTLFKYEFLK